MTINKKKYTLEEVPLTTTRPFVMDQIVLKDVKSLNPKDMRKVEKYLRDLVRSMIEKANTRWIEEHPIESKTQSPPKPLIRLKVGKFYS